MQQLFPVRAQGQNTNNEGATDLTADKGEAEPAASESSELTRPISIVAPRRLGETDLVVFPLALGGSVFGWTANSETSVDILDKFMSLGGNLLDTADSYAAGRSETIIGNWMHSRRNRNRVVVSTRIGRNPDNPGLSSTSIVRAVEASLERLQTDYIDVLSFHDEDPSVPLEDSLATVDWLMETGKVRYLAASNFTAERLIEARVLSSTGLPKFIAVQSHYNLMHREEFEEDLRIVASAQGLGVMPYAALAGGYLTGKYRNKDDAAGPSAREGRALSYVSRRGNKVLGVVDKVAAAHESTPASVALAWLMAKRMIAAPVASVSSPEQMDALMSAAAVRLTRAQMLDLDRVSE